MDRKARALVAIALMVGLLAPAPVWAGGGKKHFKQGLAYEAEKKYDQAAEAFLAALAAKPDKLEYRIAYRRAATHASVMLVRRGRELMEQGQYEEAYNNFRRAYQFDKTNELAKDMARRALELQRKVEGVAPVPMTQTPYGATVPQAGQAGGLPPQQQLPAADQEGTGEPLGKDKVRKVIIFRDQKLEDVITDLARQLDLNVAFDSTFRSRKINAEYHNVTLAQALDTVLRSNQLFFEPQNENTIIVAQDNTANRARLQKMSVQTFYLKSIDPQVVQGQISALFGNRVIVVPNAELRSLTVRTTPETLKVVANLVRALDKDKPEVLIDISIYEVSRNDLLEIGNQLLFDGFTQGPIVPGTLNTLGVTAGQIITEQRLALAIPTTVIRALQQRGNSQLIDSLQVHALDGQEVSANVGQRIPIQTASLPSSVSTFQQGQQNPQDQQNRFVNALSLGVPQIEYQDVGLNVTITPTIYTDDDVKLEMQIETSGVQAGPTSLTPIFTQRRLKSVATVKTGQAAMMAGVAQKRRTRNRTSLPVIGFLPVIGRFFSIPSQTTDTTDLIITVTPHIIRSADITAQDKLAMSAGLQIQGVSETIESFIEQREQARRRAREGSQVAEVQGRNRGRGSSFVDRGSSHASRITHHASPVGTSAERMGAASALAMMLAGGGASVWAEPSSPGKAAGAGADVVTVHLQPSAWQLRTGQSLKVAVFAQSDQPVERGRLMIRYDPAMLKLRAVTGLPVRGTQTGGGSLSADPLSPHISSQSDPGGALLLAVRGLGQVPSHLGHDPLALITFDVVGPGRSALTMAADASQFTTPEGRKLSCVATPVAVSVK